MRLTCPHCNFSKEVPEERLPKQPTKVTCPQCKQSFSLPQHPAAEPAPEPSAAAQITCPACRTSQPRSESCVTCGLIFARYQPPAAADAPLAPDADDPANKPKAGFWLRLVALMIDGFLVFVLQVVFGVLLALASGGNFDVQGTLAILIQLFTIVLSLFYYVFFTGYCGQTPGKMLLRIQVVRAEGGPIGYGKAFYREVIGKFISGIILGIGYLMAAFDDQKQALHDRMARTYVVKL